MTARWTEGQPFGILKIRKYKFCSELRYIFAWRHIIKLQTVVNISGAFKGFACLQICAHKMSNAKKLDCAVSPNQADFHELASVLNFLQLNIDSMNAHNDLNVKHGWLQGMNVGRIGQFKIALQLIFIIILVINNMIRSSVGLLLVLLPGENRSQQRGTPSMNIKVMIIILMRGGQLMRVAALLILNIL